jgi:hypothetical protein
MRMKFAATLVSSLALVPLTSAASQTSQQLPAATVTRFITDSRSVERLRDQLFALAPSVRHDEATELATRAYSVAARLAREYRAVPSPHLHNFLVNIGAKERGLCHHWTRDLGAQLARLKLRTLELRWGISRAGTLREHNAVVVTARGQRFAEGVVLDPWRYSGRLFSGPVASDKYPWREDRSESFRAPPKR